MGPPLLVVYHTRRYGCQDKQETPTESGRRCSVAVLWAGDSYGVRAAVLGCVSTDR